ncbi:hypothetical protein WG922_04885 [Ramlibacter sp. AN1015]|uniref:hypothetical protein n=1 Tax=Ramlibacter sp. AN1015 TaxID=3133428 RepID=UPI0030BFAE49
MIALCCFRCVAGADEGGTGARSAPAAAVIEERARWLSGLRSELEARYGASGGADPRLQLLALERENIARLGQQALEERTRFVQGWAQEQDTKQLRAVEHWRANGDLSIDEEDLPDVALKLLNERLDAASSLAANASDGIERLAGHRVLRAARRQELVDTLMMRLQPPPDSKAAWYRAPALLDVLDVVGAVLENAGVDMPGPAVQIHAIGTDDNKGGR